MRLAPATPSLAALERHRDYHFRRVRHRRIHGERAALGFIEEVGFCAAFTAGMGVPCLREAIEGMREPPLPEHIQHDRAIMMTWNIKDTLPAGKFVYYGKVLGGRPSFIARDLLAAFLRLRAESCGYRALYERGMLSHCAKLVMEALTRRGAAETKALKLSAGYAQPKMRGEFDRAMKELQEKFLALKVEERYGPFTYVWDTIEHRWGETLRDAHSLTRKEAAYRVMRRYFEVAGFGNERAVARLLAIDPALVDGAARRLERERRLRRARRVEDLIGEHSILACLAD
ncbi:MAG: AlkZ-related protein [Candidatus Binataceae bacterium]